MQLWISTIMGTFVLVLAAAEVFSTVLHPRAVTGPVTSLVNRLFHTLLRSRLAKFRKVAVVAGPLLILTQILVWAAPVLFGTALIFWPQLGDGITTAGSQPTDTSFTTAVYYAGFNLTTLGIGDLVPKTAGVQWLTIGIAGLGFSYFTLILTYVMSVYSTLVSRNRIADEIDYRTAGTGKAVTYLKDYLGENKASLLNQDLFDLASSVATLLEAHHFYPAIHYFRFGEPHYSMGRMLQFCLETSTCLRSLKSCGCDEWLITCEPSNRLWHASNKLLGDALRFFVRHDSRSTNLELTDPNAIAECAHAGGLEFDHERFVEAYQETQSQWSAI